MWGGTKSLRYILRADRAGYIVTQWVDLGRTHYANLALTLFPNNHDWFTTSWSNWEAVISFVCQLSCSSVSFIGRASSSIYSEPTSKSSSPSFRIWRLHPLQNESVALVGVVSSNKFDLIMCASVRANELPSGTHELLPQSTYWRFKSKTSPVCHQQFGWRLEGNVWWFICSVTSSKPSSCPLLNACTVTSG